MSASSRGSARERQVRKLLEAEGWAVTRGAGSHGCADLWAAHFDEMQRGCVLRLIQVKTDKRGPFAHFGPKGRKELTALADQTGGTAELCWWPANHPLRWIPRADWPT